MSWALIFCQFNESFVRHEYLTSLAKLLDLEVENRGRESRIVKQTGKSPLGLQMRFPYSALHVCHAAGGTEHRL